MNKKSYYKYFLVTITALLLSTVLSNKIEAGIITHACSHVSDAIPFTATNIKGESLTGYYLEAGSYYLDNDYINDNSLNNKNYIEIKKDTVVNLCLNGHLLKVQFIVYGTLNVYDCQTTEHKYKLDNRNKYVLDETNGTISVNGGALYGINTGEKKGGAIFVEEGTLNLINVNIIGNDSNNGSGIFADKSTVNCKNVNILGNGNSTANHPFTDTIRSGAALVLNDSEAILEDTTIKDNSGSHAFDNCNASVYISGTNNKKVTLKGSTTIKDNYVTLPLGNNNFELKYSGLVVSPNGNLLNIADDFTGYIEVEVFKLINKTNSTNKLVESTLTSGNNIDYMNNFSLINSSNYTDYYLKKENDNSISICYRILKQPIATSYKYEIEEDGYNQGSKTTSYQWYEKSMEVDDLSNYVSSIVIGSATANGYASGLTQRFKPLLGISTTGLDDKKDIITFKSSNNIKLDKNTYKLGDTYYAKLSSGNLTVEIVSGSGTSFEISDVKVIKDKFTAITGETTNTLSTRNIGSYVCKATMKTGATTDKVHTSNIVNIITLVNTDLGDCEVVNSNNGSASYTIAKTKDTTLHINGVNFSDIKENDSSSDGSNPFENIKVKYNNNYLVYGSDYVLNEGSIKVTLLKSFLDTLNVGQNNIEVSLTTALTTYNFYLNVDIINNKSNNSYTVVNTATN